MTAQTDAPTLKPCPFCGGNASIGRARCPENGGWFASVNCHNCAAKSRDTYYSQGNDCPQTYSNLRDTWNRRTDYAAQAEIAKLRQEAGIFCALHATRQAGIAGYPSGHISAHFYDRMADHGMRMDGFTRVGDGTATEAQP